MISDAYKRALRDTRAIYPTWGNSKRHAAPVLLLLEAHGIHTGSVLDFGAGLCRFAEELERLAPGRYAVTNYEPSVKALEAMPDGTFDAVVATHVLEHVEPKLLDATLGELLARARRLIYIEVPHGPAGKTLADGRNAHLIQEPRDWWADKLTRAFTCATVLHWPAANPLNTIYAVQL